MEYKNYTLRFGKQFPRCKGGECTARRSCMLYLAYQEDENVKNVQEPQNPCKDYQPININQE